MFEETHVQGQLCPVSSGQQIFRDKHVQGQQRSVTSLMFRDDDVQVQLFSGTAAIRDCHNQGQPYSEITMFKEIQGHVQELPDNHVQSQPS
jgi:hypothetical protein